jgi:hypothetical protein
VRQPAGGGAVPGGYAPRFPGFDVLAEADSWDAVTAGVVLARLGMPPAFRFFTPAEESTGTALVDDLLDQHTEPRIPVLAMIDARLAEFQTDGWRYADLPEDGDAWRLSLRHLDEDARAAADRPFGELGTDERTRVLSLVQTFRTWHGLPSDRIWSLWTRYACTAFYSHPWAWNEIGFPGPAYPRGYKNLGLDRREPFEVADAGEG